MALAPTRVETARLVLVPVSHQLAEAVVSGELSGVNAAQGWPHEDTVDGLQMALTRRHTAGWFVTLNGVVIGDCGVHGEPDDVGEVEIGFGLAAPYRGRGYGRELVGAMAAWLLRQPEVARVSARVLVDNTPSSRVLEAAGFRLDHADEQYARYLLERAAG